MPAAAAFKICISLGSAVGINENEEKNDDDNDIN